jgi:hypothetical protein
MQKKETSNQASKAESSKKTFTRAMPLTIDLEGRYRKFVWSTAPGIHTGLEGFPRLIKLRL